MLQPRSASDRSTKFMHKLYGLGDDACSVIEPLLPEKSAGRTARRRLPRHHRD
jgi:hypothetical protein